MINNYIKKKNRKCEVDIGVFLNEDGKNYVGPDIGVICDEDKLSDRGCSGAQNLLK